MPNNIKRYTDIIHIQSSMLMDSNKTYLSDSQQQAIERINRYTSALALVALQLAVSPDEQMAKRHELINILTPIVGYVEMLADGWMGRLNPDQVAHLEIIHQSMNDLRALIISRQYDEQEIVSESA